MGIILGGAAAWPFFERWVASDNAWHQINDRPRNAPARTGIGVAAVVFYGVLPAPDANGVPAPGRAGVLGKFRIALNGAFTESTAAATEANGYAGDTKHQPVDGPGELPASETRREASSTSGTDRSA